MGVRSKFYVERGGEEGCVAVERSTLVTLDVRGCLNVTGRAPDKLLLKLPLLTNFVVHS
jgi:hypothetical protein